MVEQAAGRGDDDVDAARERAACGPKPTPPKIAAERKRRCLP
jgi:hypothetical protein